VVEDRHGIQQRNETAAQRAIALKDARKLGPWGKLVSRNIQLRSGNRMGEQTLSYLPRPILERLARSGSTRR
jgi:hypothetical protein